MRKTIIQLTVVSAVFAILIIACKKDLRPGEDQLKTDKSTSETGTSKEAGRSADLFTISPYGFMVFETPALMDEYRSVILDQQRTHGELQAELTDMGFNSLGATLYGEEYLDQQVTEEQTMDYILNPALIFQVGDAIIKPIDERNAEVKWQFLLVMTPENLAPETYEMLQAGSFDVSTMNKFATNLPDDQSVEILDFIKETPAGFEQTEISEEAAMRPMFGSVSSEAVECGQSYYSGTGNCVRGCQRVKTTKHYAFWIKVDTDETIIGSWAEPATGC